MQEEGKDPQEQGVRESRKVEAQLRLLLIVSVCYFHSPAGARLFPIGYVRGMSCVLLQFQVQKYFHLWPLCYMQLVLFPCQLEAPAGGLLCPIAKVIQTRWFGLEFGFGLDK